jgi:acyl-CoA reductase-like NAD-dependent aldehyde dehydrogenase
MAPESFGVFVANSERRGRGETLELVDPSTGATTGELASATDEDVDLAVASAREAASRWAATAPVERARVCARVAQLLVERSSELAETAVVDAGLPSSMAIRDVETAGRYFEFYAGVPDKLYGDSIPVGPDAIDYTIREPWGVCAVILPFNFPFQLTARDVAAALCTGNTVVLKPPEQAPLAALALVKVCAAAGVPDGVVNAVTGMGPEVGERLVRHPDVDHVTFTGSVATARRVLEAAAQDIKPTTIELGGKSPHVVFADARIDRVVASIVATTFRSAGQACSAGTRVLVERGARDELLSALGEAASGLRVGIASDDPDLGPLVSATQRDNVLAAVDRGRSDGARVVTGGGPPASGDVPPGGFFVAPTVLDDVDPSSAVAIEEIFGPVVTVTTFDDEAGAIALANNTEFGLVGGIWTADLGRAHRLARAIDAGQIFVNSYGVGGGVELPFGGYKHSGFGRVKGMAGALEYTQLKNVFVNYGGG